MEPTAACCPWRIGTRPCQLRSDNIRSWSSKATRSETRQPVYRNREKTAPARTSSRNSTSRSRPPHFVPLHPFGGKLLATKLFDRLGRVRLQVAVLTEPSEISADRDQGPIDRCDGLTLVPAQVILEIGHVPDGDPLDGERLPIGMAEPTGELPQVVADRTAGVGGQVMGGKVGRNQPALLRPDRQALENIIARILTAFWTDFWTPF